MRLGIQKDLLSAQIVHSGACDLSDSELPHVLLGEADASAVHEAVMKQHVAVKDAQHCECNQDRHLYLYVVVHAPDCI